MVVKCDLEESKWSATEQAALNTECDAIANLLVKADELLAQTALDDAKATPVQHPNNAQKVERQLNASAREIVEAHGEWDEREYGVAICHFGEAWEHAERAISIANRP